MSENKKVQALKRKIIDYGLQRSKFNVDRSEALFREIEADLAVLSASAGEKKDADLLAEIMRHHVSTLGPNAAIFEMPVELVDRVKDAIRATNSMQSTNKDEK